MGMIQDLQAAKEAIDRVLTRFTGDDDNASAQTPKTEQPRAKAKADGDGEGEKRAARGEVLGLVLRLIKKHGPITTAKLVAKSGKDYAQVYQGAVGLEKKGLVTKNDEKQWYAIPEEEDNTEEEAAPAPAAKKPAKVTVPPDETDDIDDDAIEAALKEDSDES